MKKCFVLSVLFLALLSCNKENPNENNTPDPTVPVSEFEALKQQVKELKTQIEALTSGTPETEEPGVSVDEFNKLKQENEQLKAQVESLTSVFFEVDGLRFDQNGDIISTPKIENTYKKDSGNYGTFSMTRSFDDKGRLIETYGRYSGYSSAYSPPYYWQRVKYEYSGKTRKTTTQTSSYSYGIYTHEESSETTYW